MKKILKSTPQNSQIETFGKPIFVVQTNTINLTVRQI